MRTSHFHPVRFFCAVLLLASLTLAHGGSAESGRHFLWKVQSKTSTLYLLGSIHFLKQENYPLHAAIEQAFAQSSFLVVEADTSDVGKLNTNRLLGKALYPENDSIRNHLTPETYELLVKETGKVGLSPEVAARQRPWFLALTLEALELVKLGFDPGYGIDSYFLSRAQGSKKVLELEGIEEQIDLLSGFAEKEQELFLLYTLKDLRILADEVTRLVNAWSTGDTSGMESIITRAVRQDRRLEPVFKKLLDDRNKRMASTIEGYLGRSGNYFVVIGAAHLIGDKGIVTLLKNKGYTVEQL